MAAVPARALGEALSDLKRRCGRSYTALERSTGLSRSTLHRYCQGAVVPGSYAIVERIALACDAGREELADLYRLWAEADAHAQPDPPAQPAVPAAAAPGDPVDPTPALATSPSGSSRPLPIPMGRTRPRILAFLAALLLAAGVMASVVNLRAAAPTSPAPTQRQVTGPAWAQPPTGLAPSMFGVTINSTSGAMPDFRLDAVRLWDSRTRWANLEPSPGVYDWTVLDRLVAGAERAQLPVLLTFGGTPGWASPDGPRTAYDDDSRTSPPVSLADWDRFVTEVASRYRGRIEAYEVWDAASSPQFWSGDVPTLVEMTSRAAGAIRREDPGATVVCPSVGRLWTPETRDLVTRFAAAGGYDSCDVVGVKLQAADVNAAPEASVPVAEAFANVLQQAAVRLPIWNTGAGYGLPDEAPLPDDLAGDYAARFWLVGIYVRYERTYFYNWGSPRMPLILQAEGQPPTQAARGVEELHRWFAGARVGSCGRGPDDGTPPGAWQCRLVLSGNEGSAREATVQWTTGGGLPLPPASTDRLVRHLDGRIETLPAGAPLNLTGSPVLVEVTTPPVSPPR